MSRRIVSPMSRRIASRPVCARTTPNAANISLNAVRVHTGLETRATSEPLASRVLLLFSRWLGAGGTDELRLTVLLLEKAAARFHILVRWPVFLAHDAS